MCGRFTLTASPEAIATRFDLDEVPALAPRFNIAPGQDVATVEAAGGGRRLVLRRWGLVPHWARDPKLGSRLINARAETVDAKPAFRDAFRRRRCLVPADGFYEWAAAGAGPRQPYWIARPDGACFAIAGLAASWRGADDQALETCTLITTEASDPLRAVHGRMPVILDPADWAPWLDPERRDPAELLALLRPAPADALVPRPVSRRVNRPDTDDAACIAPAGAPG